MFSNSSFEPAKFKGFRTISNDLSKKLGLSTSQLKSICTHKDSLREMSLSHKELEKFITRFQLFRWIKDLHKLANKYLLLTSQGFDVFKKIFDFLTVEQLSKLTLNFEDVRQNPSLIRTNRHQSTMIFLMHSLFEVQNHFQVSR